MKKQLRKGSLMSAISDNRYTFKHKSCIKCGRLSGVKDGLCFQCRKKR